MASGFAPLTDSEVQSDWGRELLIGSTLAQEQDFYQAILALKRARILQKHHTGPRTPIPRQDQVAYDMCLAYMLSSKYDVITHAFETGKLDAITPESPVFTSALIILYDAYLHQKNPAKAQEIYDVIENQSKPKAAQLKAYKNIFTLDKEGLLSDPKTEVLYTSYSARKKHPMTAGALNAVLPGSGYVYVGQIQSGVTSLMLNALFIAATYQFATHHQVAPAIISFGFEMGWYVGGIHGAYLAAEEYNNTLYSAHANEYLRKEKLFPIFQIEYGF